MKAGLLFTAVILSGFCHAYADNEFLGEKTFDVSHSNIKAHADRVLIQGLKNIFKTFKLELDNTITVISPLVVGGTNSEPVLKTTLRKCVLIICETVSFDALVTAEQTKGACALNYLMVADLSRSDELISDNYSQLSSAICIQPRPGKATVKVKIELVRSDQFAKGIMQGEVLNMLRMQVNPLVDAFKNSLM